MKRKTLRLLALAGFWILWAIILATVLVGIQEMLTGPEFLPIKIVGQLGILTASVWFGLYSLRRIDLHFSPKISQIDLYRQCLESMANCAKPDSLPELKVEISFDDTDFRVSTQTAMDHLATLHFVDAWNAIPERLLVPKKTTEGEVLEDTEGTGGNPEEGQEWHRFSARSSSSGTGKSDPRIPG